MKIQIAKLGSPTVDLATGLKGTLTHCNVGLHRTAIYAFTPRGLNQDTMQPLIGRWLTVHRLKNPEVEFVDFPMEILGTEVRDNVSGAHGMALALTRHINGCVHVAFQPKGKLKNGNPIDEIEVDVRRLSGKMIPAMTEAERRADECTNPSPAGCSAPSHRL